MRADRPLRVVHVVQNLNYGGMERVIHHLARHLPSRGLEVHVVVLQFLGRFAEGLEGQAHLHQAPRMPRWSLAWPEGLARVFRTIRPDIVHSHAGVWLKAARAARIAGVPYVVHTEHGRPSPIPWSDRLIDNVASRSTDVVIAVSDALAEVLRDEVVHEAARVRVIPNGVDTAAPDPRPDPAALRARLGLPRHGAIIGSVGRLERVKNYPLALRAFAQLPARPDGPGPWLVLVGDGSQRASLEALAMELGIAERVRFLGWRTDAEAILGALDLFVLSSVSEGTSVSLLEAMASGVCPVVTDVGGNRGVLGQGLEALLVPSQDEKALARRLQSLLDDPAGRRRLAIAARERVADAFSVDQMVDRHVEMYRSLARPS